jgi:hypothetical protein
MLVFGDRDFAELMFEKKKLGRVQWRNGLIAFDPPLSRGPRANAFDDDLDEWASLAYARSLIDPDPRPLSIEDLNASNDE